MATNEITIDSVVTVVKDQAWSDLGDEAAILHLGTGKYYTLDGVGGRIWALMLQPTPISRIHAALLAEYDVDSRQLETDLVSLVTELRREGLVEVRNGHAA